MASSFVAPAAGSGAGAAALPAVSTPSGGGFDLGAAIDAIPSTLDDPTPDAAVDDAVVADTPIPDAAAAPDDATPPVDAKVEAAAPEPDEEEFPAPDRVVDKNGKKLHLYEPQRLEKWREARKTLGQLETAMPGFTPEQAIQDNQTALGARQLMQDFDSNTPENLDKVVGYFGRTNPEALGMMAMRLPGTLAEVNPQAFEALADGFFETKLEGLYHVAAEQARSGAAGADNFLKALQVVEHHLTGKYRKADDFKAQSPVDARLADVTQREQALAQRSARDRQTSIQTFHSQTESEVGKAQEAAIETGLESVKEAFKERPNAYRHLVRDFKEAIEQRIAATPQWVRQNNQIKQQIELAVSKGDRVTADKLRGDLVTRHKQLTADVVRANRKRLIEADTAKVVADNAKVHEKQAAASRQTETVATGAASAKNGAGGNDKLKNAKTLNQAWDALGF